ncbi:MAG: Helix-turn-helix domain protein [Syntrophorhabdus sp. PtaB.Bin047]|jgi:DNA-binding XRE family transcriptional regulator|nr:MAG: Helix-turn-helix domain protein [Syntrophorhabdus sp. PtaB.Bin047]
MINNNIKLLRDKLGLNQGAFAKTIGVRQSTLSIIESGGRVTGRIITTICAVHNVNRSWLETGKGSMFNEPATGGPSSAALMIAERLDCYRVTDRPRHEVEEIREMLNALLEILTSDNDTVKYAIKSNLVAFRHTVRSDNKIIEQEADIKRLCAEMNELKQSLSEPRRLDTDFKTQGSSRESKQLRGKHRVGGK